ncbi:MAG: O-antigen ligase family protein [Pseudomonadota bacterium]|nr:O-antigen ligase family protein [Pseudomonadota bacterium]
MITVLRGFTLLGVCSVVLFLPLAKGGNSDWARGVAVAVIPALFALNWPVMAAGSQERRNIIWPWLLVWAAVSFWIGVQLLPGFGSLIGSPLSVPCVDGGVCESQRIAPFPMATASHWAMFSVYWMAAWLVSQLERGQVKVLVSVIALLALFEASYGILAFVSEQETILGIWEKEYYRGDVTGTFVNRNHFSGFLELSWPLALSLILLPARRGGFHWPQNVRYVVAGLFSLIVGLAILNSHSRLGTVSAIAGLVVWSLAMRRSSEAGGLDTPRWVGRAVMAVALVGGVWFGLETLLERFVNLPEAEGRFRIWSSLMTLPSSTWLTGIGAGAFIDVFRAVQPPGMESLYYYAHSDVLEFFLDFGVIGAALILSAVILWFRRALPDKLSLLQIGALGGMAAIFVHSFGDFNLHISGVAMVFWVAVGILVNPNLQREKRRLRRGAKE